MAWKPEYVFLIICSTLIAYYTAIQMGKNRIKSIKRKYLLISLLTNLGILFAFKYFNFFNASTREIFNYFNIFYDVPMFNVLLPVGISFYTFQTLSYSIDVYKEKREPEKHIGIFALYVAFFPQLVAGPIERSTRLLPQFKKAYTPNYERITNGLKLMVWGFFKKVVIADRLAVAVNQIYNNPTEYTGVPLILATYFFAFQIYCDFSGYSDIAIGSAQIMGFKLMDNFKRPYLSKSVSEFWKRWHISLSSWFRDYLYIPLGGSRVAKFRLYINLMIVFLVSGLWHGANWTFIVWGALHGFYLVFSIWTKSTRAKLNKLLNFQPSSTLLNLMKIFFTFHLVIFAWIFFRANTLSDAYYIITHLFKGIEFKITGYGLSIGTFEFTVAIFAIFLMEIIQYTQEKIQIRLWLAGRSLLFRWASYYMMTIVILIFGYFESNTDFIYFQF
jgi:D-alanyl-lipoteichoic acid acyltransferase DltB (MBOAT superfamily)